MKKAHPLILICLLGTFLLSGCHAASSSQAEDKPVSQETEQGIRTENWPQFRGLNASGTAEGQDLPLHWDVDKGTDILWKRPIPGLGHSSPVVWGDRVFVTTAVGEGKEAYLKVGRYGSSPENPEHFVHHYKVYCIDRHNGTILWERLACRKVPASVLPS